MDETDQPADPIGWTRRSALYAAGTAAASLLAPAAWARGAPGHDGEAPEGLLCNLLSSALAVPHDAVRLSWMVPRLSASTMQAACQLHIAQVTGSAGEHLVWDSGRMVSSCNVAVAVPEGRLAPDTPYVWRVRIWDTAGERSRWSAPQLFITAPSRWQARPIWAPAIGKGDTPADWALLRRGFEVHQRPVLAWLRVTATSPEPARQYVFRLWVNGKHAGVGPSRSPGGDAQPRYQTFDVTALIAPGANALGALCYAAEGQAFQLELVLLQSDGSRHIIASDASWRAWDGGPWRSPAGFTGGGFYTAPQEYLDARQEPTGWVTPAYDDRGWGRPLARSLPADLQPASTAPLIREPVVPSRMTRRPTSILVDFGREIIGGLALDLRGVEGETLEIRLGEELDESGEHARYQLRCGQVYRETWTLREGTQRLEHWGYRAFRWVEILHGGKARIEAVTGVRLGLPWRDEARFTSSDASLDKVRDFCAYSIRATRLDLYQDTPTRERGAYEGDAIVNQSSEYALQRSFALARYSAEYLARRPTWPTEYRLMIPLLAWRDYLATGDDRFLQSHYETMISAQLFGHLNADGLVEKAPGRSSEINGDLVDWPKANRDGFEFQPVNTVVNAWQYGALRALIAIAESLGRSADAARFAHMAGRLQQALNQATLLPNGCYRDGIGTDHSAQHATAFAIALGVAPPEAVSRGAAQLASQGMRMSVYGAQFLLEALYKGGQANAALALMTSRGNPSWLHMIERWHASITMEAWDPALKPNTTFSHAWGTAPANIIARFVAGVEICKAGAAHLVIAPNPGRLRYFDTSVPTIRGAVRLSYDRRRKDLWRIIIPPNVRADLCLPIEDEGAAHCRVTTPLGIRREPIKDGAIHIANAPAGAYRLFSGIGM